MFFKQKKRKIAIKVATVNEIDLHVFQYDDKDTKHVEPYSVENSSFEDWVYIKENYVPVDLTSYPGFTKIQKYELFLAHFSTPKFVPI